MDAKRSESSSYIPRFYLVSSSSPNRLLNLDRTESNADENMFVSLCQGGAVGFRPADQNANPHTRDHTYRQG